MQTGDHIFNLVMLVHVFKNENEASIVLSRTSLIWTIAVYEPLIRSHYTNHFWFQTIFLTTPSICENLCSDILQRNYLFREVNSGDRDIKVVRTDVKPSRAN